jgi:hypothetical protein
MMQTKQCKQDDCKKIKPLTDFYKSKSGKYGVESICKECRCKNSKIYDINNNRKEYRDNFYQQNKDKHFENGKKWRKLNPDKIKEINRKCDNKRYQTNPEYKLKKLIRGRMISEIGKIKNGSTNDKMNEYLGCSLNDLKIYIENKFTPDMNWNNHGNVWELDHIKPCSLFDFTDVKQQKECFHYTNLQPLYKEDNRKKSNKYE